ADIGNAYWGELLWSGDLIQIDAQRWLNKEWDDEKQQQFWMEISMLSSLKHKNLVSLVGFCDEHDEKIIVIKQETRGSLVNDLDPTCLETKSVSQKSDIYSFGIVMFELLCSRKAVIDDDHDNKYLALVAAAHYREKKLDEIIDWDLWNQMDSQSFNIFAEIAYDCLNEERSERPNIDEIVTRLHFVL
nr:receptor-like tyrosine-protein kinase kin-15 [Tanacetum cinerariifolium]